MYKHILVATDGSELAGKAVAHGLALTKALGARVTAVTVTEPWTAAAPGEVGIVVPADEYEGYAAAHARRILGQVKEAAEKEGVACDTLHVPDRFPAEGILEAAKKVGADLIVMASHGRRGVIRILLGSQAAQVVSHSTIPVLICR